MPLTFPSHAAAIVPLYTGSRRRLHPTALVIGSMAPDLVYLLRWSATPSHNVRGMFTFCLPAGLLFILWTEGLVLPLLAPAVPSLGPVQPGRFLHTRRLPRTGGGWLIILGSLFLGSLTHLLWDGFTHASMWPARALYPKIVFDLLGARLPLPTLLQHGSSIVGAVLFSVFLVRLYPRLPPVRGGPLRPFLLGLLFTTVLSAAAFAVRFHRPLHHEPVRRSLWFASWTATDAAMIGITLICLWLVASGVFRRLRPGERES